MPTHAALAAFVLMSGAAGVLWWKRNRAEPARPPVQRQPDVFRRCGRRCPLAGRQDACIRDRDAPGSAEAEGWGSGRWCSQKSPPMARVGQFHGLRMEPNFCLPRGAIPRQEGTFLVSLVGGMTRRVDDDEDVVRPALSPDGSRLALADMTDKRIRSSTWRQATRPSYRLLDPSTCCMTSSGRPPASGSLSKPSSSGSTIWSIASDRCSPNQS